MTAHTEAQEIALLVRPSIGERSHMMHQSRQHQPSLSLTCLAEWMHQDITVTDFLPRVSVSLVLTVATGEMLVMLLHHAPVFLAVTALAVGQIGTATVSAGAFGFRWHQLHLNLGKRKPRKIAPPRLALPSFSSISISELDTAIHCHLLPTFIFSALFRASPCRRNMLRRLYPISTAMFSQGSFCK